MGALRTAETPVGQRGVSARSARDLSRRSARNSGAGTACLPRGGYAAKATLFGIFAFVTVLIVTGTLRKRARRGGPGAPQSTTSIALATASRSADSVPKPNPDTRDDRRAGVEIPSPMYAATAHALCDSAMARAVPIVIEPLVTLPLGLDDQDVDAALIGDLRSKLWSLNGLRPTASHLMHLLRIGGPGVPSPHDQLCSTDAILRLFTDSDAGAAYFGTATLVRTRSGVCSSVLTAEPGSPSAVAKEAHRDQLLCLFSELRLPLDYPLAVGRERYTLNEMLQDSIANFSIRQRELE